MRLDHKQQHITIIELRLGVFPCYPNEIHPVVPQLQYLSFINADYSNHYRHPTQYLWDAETSAR